MEFSLKDWQARHGFTYESAAQALGVGRITFYNHLKLKPEELPKLWVLACRMIDADSKRED